MFIFYTFCQMSNKSSTTILLALSVLFTAGCRNSSVHSIPDAPPPYPNFPVPQERYNSAQVYGGQSSNLEYVPPYSDALIPQTPPATFYSPPPTSAQQQQTFSQEPAYNFSPYPNTSRPQSLNQQAKPARFTLEANADLWALIQDSKGVELEWLKMKKGDMANLQHIGELTITCSSGDQLTIKDKSGKLINTNPNSSGISIVRLPAN